MANLLELMSDPNLCKRQARSLQRTIAFETIKIRGVRGLKQYGRYFTLFWLYGLLEPDRARLIKSSYFWFRHIDDIADSDKPLPWGYSTKREYLKIKRNIIKQLS